MSRQGVSPAMASCRPSFNSIIYSLPPYIFKNDLSSATFILKSTPYLLVDSFSSRLLTLGLVLINSSRFLTLGLAAMRLSSQFLTLGLAASCPLSRFLTLGLAANHFPSRFLTLGRAANFLPSQFLTLGLAASCLPARFLTLGLAATISRVSDTRWPSPTTLCHASPRFLHPRSFVGRHFVAYVGVLDATNSACSYLGVLT